MTDSVFSEQTETAFLNGTFVIRHMTMNCWVADEANGPIITYCSSCVYYLFLMFRFTLFAATN